MKKKIGWFLVLFIIGGIMTVLLVPKRILRNLYYYSSAPGLEVRQIEPVIATFDYNTKELVGSTDSFQYVNFRVAGTDRSLSQDFKKLDPHLPVFVTVDMWNPFILESPLVSITKGKYDERIREICGLLSNTQQPVYIRWNPEMEVVTNVYPWQLQSPVRYNEAFRHFSVICKELLPNVKIVWSTAGHPGVLDFLPKEDFFDYISITVDSRSEKSTTAYPGYTSLSDQISRKIHRMRFVNKPVLVLTTHSIPDGNSISAGILETNEFLNKNLALIYETTSVPEENPSGKKNADLKLGVYDPDQKLNDLNKISTEHIFLDWNNIVNGSFREEIDKVVARKHDIIVTLEPWKEIKVEPDSNVLLSVINGKYDDRFRKFFNYLEQNHQTVYLRWTHEMEIPVTRYPWQSQPPVNYIKAFRHFASFRKPENTNIKLVWGPAGDRSLQDFWPGGDVVDYISIAIYGLPDKNITDHKKQESFKTIFNRKNNRIKFFNKPIFITEFGIKGPDEFQREWLLAAAKTINETPQIKGVCYFNMADTPLAWGDIEAPVWKVSRDTYQVFINALNLDTKSVALNKK